MLVSDARQNGRSYRLRDEAFDVHKRLRNEPEYEGDISEAPVISCNVPDINYAAAAEKSLTTTHCLPLLSQTRVILIFSPSSRNKLIPTLL